MTLLDVVEDALLDALERGANLPREFTVRMPWDSIFEARTLLLAGLVVHVIPEGQEQRCVH